MRCVLTHWLVYIVSHFVIVVVIRYDILINNYTMNLINILVIALDNWGYSSSLVPRSHPLTRKNGLVNQVKFLGLTGALATV